MFTNGTVIVLVWVDDCIFYSKDTKDIVNMISNLKDKFIVGKMWRDLSDSKLIEIKKRGSFPLHKQV